jgi:D-alanyl-D-alanine carboxypeptidase
MIKYHLDANGGFTVGDVSTGRTAYAYPSSFYATRAKRSPIVVAAAMLEEANADKFSYQRIKDEYDARNWAVLDKAPSLVA